MVVSTRLVSADYSVFCETSLPSVWMTSRIMSFEHSTWTEMARLNSASFFLVSPYVRTVIFERDWITHSNAMISIRMDFSPKVGHDNAEIQLILLSDSSDEIGAVVGSMYTLLGIAHAEDYPPPAVAKDVMKKLDVSNDGRVSKDEFIHHLMKDGICRITMNPFHWCSGSIALFSVYTRWC